MDSRARMLAEVSQGGLTPSSGDASTKRILGRGCDPVMAERAAQMLPPMLGGAQILTATDDDHFIKLLSGDVKFDVIFFAPGACRWSAAKKPIPGGNSATAGWGIDQYKAFAREKQPDARIVETVEEREIVPLLRSALELQG